jgi:hypothetical protein
MKKILFLILILSGFSIASAQVQPSYIARIIIIENEGALPTSSQIDDGVLCYVKSTGNLYFNKKNTTGWTLTNAQNGTTPSGSLWELDATGNSRPSSTAGTDSHWELDSYGNIRPK